MSIQSSISATPEEQRVKILRQILEGATTPAFGALPKKELELLLVEAMVAIGYLDSNPSTYELVRKLRVTSTRARSIIYDRELRRQDSVSLEEMAAVAIRHPLLQSHRYVVAMDIENPYLAEHLRDKIRSLGFASDGSFSPTLIRITESAAAALIDAYLSQPERKAVSKALAAEFGKSMDARTLIAKALAAGAAALAGKAGEELASAGANLVGSFFSGSVEQIRNVFQTLIGEPPAGGSDV